MSDAMLGHTGNVEFSIKNLGESSPVLHPSWRRQWALMNNNSVNCIKVRKGHNYLQRNRPIRCIKINQHVLGGVSKRPQYVTILMPYVKRHMSFLNYVYDIFAR